MQSEFGTLATKEEYLAHALLVEQRETNKLLRELIELRKPTPAPVAKTTTTTKAGVK